MRRPRVGLLGARRRRQGLGPFVARHLVAAGCEVPCFAGTSDATNALAAAHLRAEAGIEPRAYTDAAAMLAAHELDALAVLTPPAAHEAGLLLALEHGLHVLCEKPLLWFDDGRGTAELVREGERLVSAFAERGLLLRENCQWPYTLEAFAALHPGLGPAPRVERFAMRLSPASRGEGMLVDSLHHPLSLLGALAPAGEVAVEDVRLSSRDRDTADLDVHFTYRADGRPVDVAIELRRGETVPREAGYAVDGRWAHRLVRTSDYAMFLADGARIVDVPDPLAALLADFAAALAEALRERGAAGAAEARGAARGRAPAADARASRGPHASPIGTGNEAARLRMMVQRLRALAAVVDAFRGRP